MSGAMTVDFREYDKAMIQYAAASGKDFKDVVNRQLLNLSIQGVKLQKRAARDEIKALKDKPWWPKLVSKVLREKQGRFSQADYDRTSKALIRKSLRSIGFMRFFFIRMSQVVSPLTGKPPRKGKTFGGFDISLAPATNKTPTTTVSVKYDYKNRSAADARGADKLLQKILPRAIQKTVADMKKYTDRKMGITAKKFSARGAR
jgi:hypothetical protein